MNYLGFASQEFCLRYRFLGFFIYFIYFFMVWLSVQAFGFCVMSWFNGMVEFLVILVNGKMVVLGNCDRTNIWLPTYPLDRRIRSSRSSLMMIFLFALIFAQVTLSGFQDSLSFKIRPCSSCSSLCFSSRFALYSFQQPQLLHWFEEGKVKTCGVEY